MKSKKQIKLKDLLSERAFDQIGGGVVANGAKPINMTGRSFGKKEGVLKEKAWPQKMVDARTATKVNNIISLLKQIDIDGETMEYILKKVGMDAQMKKQLR